MPPPPLFLVAAQALGSNRVEVELSTEPLDGSPLVAGDAFNPASWVVQRLDSGFQFSVLTVQQIDPTHFIIITLEAFGPAAVFHQVASATLRGQAGQLISAPGLANFAGVDTAEAAAAIAAGPVRDWLMDANHDLAVVNGDFQLVGGAKAVPQSIDISVNMWAGDVFYDETIGLDWPEQVLVKNPDPLLVRELIRQRIARVPDVTDTIGTLPRVTPDRQGTIVFAVATVYSTEPTIKEVNQQ